MKLWQLLVLAPIMQPPNFSMLFEIMCDTFELTMRIIIVQKKNKMSHVIYYDSRTFIHAQKNYTTTEKELLAIVLALSKF